MYNKQIITIARIKTGAETAQKCDSSTDDSLRDKITSYDKRRVASENRSRRNNSDKLRLCKRGANAKNHTGQDIID